MLNNSSATAEVADRVVAGTEIFYGRGRSETTREHAMLRCSTDIDGWTGNLLPVAHSSASLAYHYYRAFRASFYSRPVFLFKALRIFDDLE